MDVLCKNGCGTVVAQVEVAEGGSVPELDLLCEACGLAAATTRITAETTRLTKRLSFLKVVAEMSGFDTEIPELDPKKVSVSEQIAFLTQELGAT